MAQTFNMLRANDLIWSFVVNNYLMGKEPFQFDLLYWNSDATRMPARMHSFYLRNMYQQNQLAQPGGIELEGVKIDLTTIDVPAYFVSTREDHIAPWKSTYRGTQLLGGREPFRAGGIRTYRRRGQPAGCRKIQPLDERDAAADAGGLVRRGDGDGRVLVAGLAALGQCARWRAGAGAGAGHGRAAGDRGCPGELCTGARIGL